MTKVVPIAELCVEDLVELLEVGIVLVDCNGHTRLFNAEARRILGTPAMPLPPGASTAWHGIYHADGFTRYPELDLPLIRALGGRRSDNVEMVVRHASFPQGICVHASGRPWMANGLLQGGLVVLKDVTAATVAQRRLRILYEITNSLSSGPPVSEAVQSVLAILLREWGCSNAGYWVPVAKDQWRCAESRSDSSAAAIRFDDKIRGRMLDRSAALPTDLLDSGAPVRFDTLDETSVATLVSAREAGLTMGFAFPVLVDGELAGIVEVFWKGDPAPLGDLREKAIAVGSQMGTFLGRKQTEEALERSNRNLEEFAYVASHDLQEPLRKILSFSERLTSRLTGKLDGDTLEYFSRMQSAATRMKRLINDLLAFARVSKVVQEKQAVDLGRVTQRVVADLESSIAQAHATVTVGDLPVVLAHESHMEQLMTNLLTNALKFVDPQRQPLIHVSSGATAAGPVEIRVADNGIGFDEKYLTQIFTVFKRLHGVKTYEGTGIGLAICRRIVELHSGTITAHSTVGEGATFVVTLPRGEDHGNSSAARQDPDGGRR